MGELTVYNNLNFTDVSRLVHLRYTVEVDGVETENGALDLPALAPGQSTSLPFAPADVPASGAVYVRVTSELAVDFAPAGEVLLPAGHILGFDEVRWCAGSFTLPAAPATSGRITTEESATAFTLRGGNFTYIFDRLTGAFSSMEFAGRPLLISPMDVQIWRAPTDNDMYIRQEWQRAHFNQAYTRTYSTSFSTGEDGAVEIATRLGLVAPTVQRIMTVDATWKVAASGQVDVRLTATKDPEFPSLPRFGLRLFLPDAMASVRYFGLGPHENYLDKHHSVWHSLFENTVEGLHEDYIMPQENGSRSDVSFVQLNGEGLSLAVTGNRIGGKEGFSFNASPFTAEEITRATRNTELRPAGATVLSLDYQQNGIGSNSCGPELLPQYRFDATEFTFELTLAPSVLV
ncbi:MAG: DUF4981 domain-containing protein [Rothia sp. (in: high G+C Gram-positive bacteria)]|nr:DUF4981 domain-containing protein [Rothia sp. (in: high G+C Gram-positive bacteria)]